MIDNELQETFEVFLKKADDFCQLHVKSKTSALVMAEVFIVKVKDLFHGKGYSEDDALLFIQHALQELNDTKPTKHWGRYEI